MQGGQGGDPCLGFCMLREDPFLMLFQFPILQLKTWLL